MKGPSYHAIVAGEVISIIKCTPVPVALRRVDQCYLEIPITQNNQSYFINRLSRIIVRRGTHIECGTVIPTGFLLDGDWYTLNPGLVKTQDPLTFSPSSGIEWHYKKIENLAAFIVTTTWKNYAIDY